MTSEDAKLADGGARQVPHPTRPSPIPPGLGSVLARNLRMMEERRGREEATATFEERVADAITRFTGSMRFVYLHVVLFGGWILVNLGVVPGVPKFDPSFVILAMAASVEAIFLSTFILISQNRMTATAQKRAELDLQINLLTEHEVTKLVALLSLGRRPAGGQIRGRWQGRRIEGRRRSRRRPRRNRGAQALTF